METADLKLGERTYALPVFEGSEGEKALDISTLRRETGYITLDGGYENTGSCKSAITFVDGEKGVLRYRGYNIQELASTSSFLEVAYLLIYGELPTPAQYAIFRTLIDENSLIHEKMHGFFNSLPPTAHPMAVLSSTINMLSIYYPTFFVDDNNPDTFKLMAAKLLSTIRTIAAFSYKKSIGEPLVYPQNSVSYTANFLNMMFSRPNAPHNVDPEVERALELLLILHADHEQNCSTSTVRLVGSSRVNLYSAICAAICALWGPLHGGANQRVIEMLDQIQGQGLAIEECIRLAKDSESNFRLMGFGHRVYKNFDPRAQLIKEECRLLFERRAVHDPLFEIAKALEDAALKDEYFTERKLYPNVDFYSGLLYRAMGIPTNMFPVMFVMGRMPGWIAHWKEMHDTLPFKIGRPRQVYIGKTERKFAAPVKRQRFRLLDIFAGREQANGEA